MENSEEILHSLEEFSKTKPKDIPRELEEYLCFVAKTGDPVYQWSAIKSLFKEKMVNVITEFYEACPSVEIPPCPNVDLFNYDVMKNFILEKLDTFPAAPFTLQRICELLTTPRKEYNRIDKYMRALEKNILVVSTTEPGGRRAAENGDGVMNGLESEHLPESSNSSNDINVEEMDDTPSWPRLLQNESESFQNDATPESQVQETEVTESKTAETICSSSQDTVITCRSSDEPYVSIEPVPTSPCARDENVEESDVSVTITAIPAGVQKRRSSVEPVVSSESPDEVTDSNETTSEVEASDLPIEEEAPSSQHIEDADSSSKDSLDDKTPDTSEPQSPPEEISQSTSDVPEKADEDITVDTTKCSQSSPEPVSETIDEPSEITSSEKEETVPEMYSSDSEAEAKQEEETSNEASSLVESNDKETVEQSQPVEVSSKSEEEVETTLMEVDDDLGSSDTIEETVKAEATSDSPL